MHALSAHVLYMLASLIHYCALVISSAVGMSMYGHQVKDDITVAIVECTH